MKAKKLKPGGRRSLIVPPDEDRIDQFDGWSLYNVKQPPSANPLWVFVKAVHVARRAEKHSPTCGRRSYRLRWGVDDDRFSFAEDHYRHFLARFPAVVARFEATCREWFTVKRAETEMRYLGMDPAKERAKLAASRHRRLTVHQPKRTERAHELALEEDRQRTSEKSVSERQE